MQELLPHELCLDNLTNQQARVRVSQRLAVLAMVTPESFSKPHETPSCTSVARCWLPAEGKQIHPDLWFGDRTRVLGHTLSAHVGVPSDGRLDSLGVSVTDGQYRCLAANYTASAWVYSLRLAAEALRHSLTVLAVCVEAQEYTARSPGEEYYLAAKVLLGRDRGDSR